MQLPALTYSANESHNGEEETKNNSIACRLFGLGGRGSSRSSLGGSLRHAGAWIGCGSRRFSASTETPRAFGHGGRACVQGVDRLAIVGVGCIVSGTGCSIAGRKMNPSAGLERVGVSSKSCVR